MTYINLSRHDARLGVDLRLRLARHLQIVRAWTSIKYIWLTRNVQNDYPIQPNLSDIAP